MSREMNKDASEMYQLLHDYLSTLNWSQGVTKDEILAGLTPRSEALATMIDEYITEDTYYTMRDILILIPDQAWQAVQGDEWHGAESDVVEEVPSKIEEGSGGQPEKGTSPQ